MQHFDAIVIGAGPSGAIASALLARQDHSVLVLERQSFPRFSIGESLLPQCMQYIEEAGMLDAVEAAGFQLKNGAMFQRRGEFSGFDFSENFSGGWSRAFEVPRAGFDKILADQAAAAGVDIRYEVEVVSVDLKADLTQVLCNLPNGKEASFSCEFILDASGFGRVLPRLLDLEAPSDFPVRYSLFTHIEDNIRSPHFDRDKILITVHPENRQVWYWLIPFSNGRSSVGVVGPPEVLTDAKLENPQILRALLNDDPVLSDWLQHAEWDTPVNLIRGYSSNVTQLCSDRFALLGNAGEFLDPVFSSGVTIAMRSASTAAALVDKQLSGEFVDWQRGYADPLMKGVNTFRSFVTAWYDGRFQDIIFHQRQSSNVRKMICSILAGYAWDTENPFVDQPERRIQSLWEICQTG